MNNSPRTSTGFTDWGHALLLAVYSLTVVAALSLLG